MSEVGSTVIGLVMVGSAAVAVVAWFAWTERRRGRAVLELAARLEAQGDYEAACFHYAVAATAGVARARCEERIRALWAAHGPFQFSKVAQDQRGSACRYESCGEGHHQLTVSDSRRIVGIQPS